MAWGPDAHQAVGAIADQLITKTHAADEVKALLGDLSLRDAAVWADCAKGIDPAKNFTYQSAGKFPECKIYESSDGEAQMSDFVRRNDSYNLNAVVSSATASVTGEHLYCGFCFECVPG